MGMGLQTELASSLHESPSVLKALAGWVRTPELLPPESGGTAR